MKLKSTQSIQWSILVLLFVLVAQCVYFFILLSDPTYGLTFDNLGFGFHIYNDFQENGQMQAGYCFSKMGESTPCSLKLSVTDPRFVSVRTVYQIVFLMFWSGILLFLLFLYRFFRQMDPGDIFTESSVKGIKRMHYVNVYIGCCLFICGFGVNSIVGKILDVYIHNPDFFYYLMIIPFSVTLGLLLHGIGYYFNNGYRLKREQELTI